MGLNYVFGYRNPLDSNTKYKGNIEKLVNEWAFNTADMLNQNAEKAGYSDKVTYKVSDEKVEFNFPEHMKFMDMKFLFWTEMPNGYAIQKWIKSKYAGAFYVPGYSENSTIGISQEKQVERISFAIAKSFYNKREPINIWAKYQRKKIWQKPQASKKGKRNLGTKVGYLARLIEEELAELISNNIQYQTK